MAPELERQLARLLAAKGDAHSAGEARQRALDCARAQGNVVTEIRALADRIAAGEAAPSGRGRLRVLGERSGADLCPHDRVVLEDAARAPSES